MKQLLSFTEADIRQLASRESFDRGYTYYRQDTVSNVIYRGNLITADVEGSQFTPYRVQVNLGADGIIFTDCTCPYDWGGICKHIVATLLVLLHNAEEVEEKPALENLLADLTESQLRQVLLGVTDSAPEVINLIEREVAWLSTGDTPVDTTSGKALPVDMRSVHREILKAFESPGSDRRFHYDYYDEYEDLALDPDTILSPHLEQLEALLDAGDIQLAELLITNIIDAYCEGLDDLDEWIYEYNIDMLAEAELSMGESLAEVLLSQELDPAGKKKWLDNLEKWAEPLGEFEIVRTALEQEWNYSPLVAAMQGNITEKGAWEDDVPDYADELTRARLRILERQGRTAEYINLATAEGQTELSIHMLAITGEIAKAVAEAKAYLINPWDFLHLAQLLARKEEIAAALDVAEHGLAREEKFGLAELAHWTRDQAAATGNDDLALQAAQVAFTTTSTLADYQAVQKLAGEKWPVIQPDLLAQLRNANSMSASNQVDIFLHENLLQDAMTAVGRSPYASENLVHRVIEATKVTHPDWGITLCKQKAERIMDAGKSGSYEMAVSWLSRAKELYIQHNRQAEWTAYLDKVLETHHRKYKLVPMLRQIQ